MSDRYGTLYKMLGYRFNDEDLLRKALTHRSVGSPNNERLEFLGDSIVNFIIADLLFKQFKETTEGTLSRVRSILVKGDSLAVMAQEFELGKYVVLSPGEEKSGGGERPSILADTLEAIIAAIYLDSNMKTVHQIVHAWYEDRLSELSPEESHKDPKTRLQEFMQSEKLPLPAYDIDYTEGEAHCTVFHVSCSVQGLDHKTKGRGSSRRRAEQDAAKKYLELLKHPL
jgi:ribonuclease III